MLKFNGGELPSDDCYYLTSEGEDKYYYGYFDLSTLENIEKLHFHIQQEEGMPNHLLFVGSAENMYCLCLGISGEQFGKVYLWATGAHTSLWFDVELDGPYEDRGETRDRSIKLADSLTELIASFKSIDEAEKWCPEYF